MHQSAGSEYSLMARDKAYSFFIVATSGAAFRPLSVRLDIRLGSRAEWLASDIIGIMCIYTGNRSGSRTKNVRGHPVSKSS